jgi:uncharacterized membrane protein SirB2
MSAYLPLLKQWHIAFALLSLGGFFLRGVLMWCRSPWLGRGVVRRLPHVIDSLLFTLGVTLLWFGPWSLATAVWLQAKLTALLLYIGLGFIALHRGRFSRRTRLFAWLAALVVFAYMLAVALTKEPWPLG